MRKLYEAQDRIQAQMLLDFLLDQGIESVVLHDYLSGGAGELPADITPTLWVLDDRDWDQAKALVLGLEKRPPGTPEAAWICANCGERLEGQFQVCWRCGSQRPGT